MIYSSPKLEAVLTDQIWRKDCYGLRAIPDTPEVILDIGANVGSFSLFAHSVWPAAKIVSLEPFPETFELLRRNTLNCQEIIALPHALGDGGEVGLARGRDSGSNRTYGPRSAQDELPPDAVRASSISLAELVRIYVPSGALYMVKLDCEGGEWSINSSVQDIPALLGACAISAELHYRCDKWPDALPIEAGEIWVSWLRRTWKENGGESEYYRLSKRAGMLKMRKAVA